MVFNQSKSVVSFSLAGLVIITPLIYLPSGSLGELGVMFSVTLLGCYASLEIYRARSLAQGVRERREQLNSSPLFQAWLLGAWFTLAGALISLIPLSSDLLALISPLSEEAWRQTAHLISLDATNPPQVKPSLSLSPSQTWRWCALQVSWILIAYLSAVTRGARKPLLWGVMLSGPLLTFVGIGHWITDASIPYGVFEMRDRSALSAFFTPLINNNHAASVMMISLFVTLGLKSGERSRDVKSFMWTLLAINALGICLTSSRAAIAITTALGALWMCKERLGHRALSNMISLYVLTALIVAPICIALYAQASWGGGGAPDAELIKGLTWRDSAQMWQHSPYWGVGRGAFGEAFTRHQTFFSPQWISHPEQLILLHIIEGGVWGVFGLLIFGITGWRWFKTRDLYQHPIALGVGFGVVAIVMHQGFDFGCESLALITLSAACWGLMWSYKPETSAYLSRRDRNTSRHKKSHQLSHQNKSRRRWGALKLGVVSLALLSLLATAHSESSYTLRSSVKRIDHTLGTISELREATAKHPVSAHYAIRFAQEVEPTSESYSKWIGRARQLAPMWSGPKILEARWMSRLGFDELAALQYQSVLVQDPSSRKVVFGDVISHPLAMPVLEWLPKRDGLPYYKTLHRASPKRARALLKSMSGAELRERAHLRALWFRRVAHRCPLETFRELTQLQKAAHREDDLILWIDLKVATHIQNICVAPTSERAEDLRQEAQQAIKRLDAAPLDASQARSRRSLGLITIKKTKSINALNAP